MLLVICYLQSIGFIPSLQCPHFLNLHGIDVDPYQKQHHGIGGFNTIFVSSAIVHQYGIWKILEKFEHVPTSFLLSGFYTFWGYHFPLGGVTASIRGIDNYMFGSCMFRNSKNWRMSIEDPFQTHDSHSPHDLGYSMDVEGQDKVMRELKIAAVIMKKMLTSNELFFNCKIYNTFKQTMTKKEVN